MPFLWARRMVSSVPPLRSPLRTCGQDLTLWNPARRWQNQVCLLEPTSSSYVQNTGDAPHCVAAGECLHCARASVRARARFNLITLEVH